ncbi:LysM peptidoglycan-binding domain-containing protein [Kineococcus sp. NPDC059986]|uniref:LysM peptidoglycan-binding domain-containing protein n=1 Tax=Kineococcus sp. NPDC059986 TaxID=3155538 RepID=UPI00344CE307
MSTTALAPSFAAPAPFTTPSPFSGPRAGRRARRCARPAAVRRVRADRRPLRLTRRGRLLVTCTAATALTGAVVAVTGAFTGASAGADRAPAPVVLTVVPGQTLSAIAAQWAPQQDWREVAGEIVQLNDLPSMTVQAGQQLTMPDLPDRH